MRYFFGQKMIKNSLVFLCFLSSGMIHAENVDRILQEYNQKNALSQKTIDENKGHLVLFSREKLEKMHATTLKDVFKTTPVIYYDENRYGLPDPLATGAFEPYRSNFIRLYIDGVEITQGWMGSGVMLYGDINIDFVDHIEFYYMIPSFETSVEPAYLTVFLYSKDSKRDSGGELNLIQGSRGYGSQSISYGKQEKDLSYMVNFSHTDAKREKIDNGTLLPLSKDFERTQLFSYIKNEDQIFHLQVLKKETDGFAGMSLDATPLISKWDYLNVHMDYGIDLDAHWHAQFAYDWLRADIQEKDEFPLVTMGFVGDINDMYMTTKNSTYSAELTYKDEIGDNRIAAGLKGRVKKLDSVDIEGSEAVPLTFSSESFISFFFQDQYAFAEYQLLTFGLEYNKIYRNGSMEDDSLLQLRLGYIYAGEKWTYKTYICRLMFSMDPLNRYMFSSAIQGSEPQISTGITQELSYTDKKQQIRLILHMMKDKESLFQDVVSGLGKDTKYFNTIFNYDYHFNIDNKVDLQLYYAYYRDIFILDRFKDISGYFSLINSYEDFDFYNGVVWHRNSIDRKNYFDLTSSISWNVNEDCTVTLKGQNILDKAKKTNLFRVDSVTHTILNPLKVSPIDRRVTLELEYTF